MRETRLMDRKQHFPTDLSPRHGIQTRHRAARCLLRNADRLLRIRRGPETVILLQPQRVARRSRQDGFVQTPDATTETAERVRQ